MMRWIHEIVGYANIALDFVTERFRTKAPEPRLWIFTEHDVKEVTCPPQIDKVLFFLGMVSSRTEAQRMLKAGSVEISPWVDGDWTKASLTSSIPSGYPQTLRLGKRYFGLKTVIVPTRGQTLRFWKSELLSS